MKFIEIRENFSVAIDKIEAIEKAGDLTCKVHTHLNSYDSTFPYQVLLQIIETEGQEVRGVQEKMFNIAKMQSYFAG